MSVTISRRYGFLKIVGILNWFFVGFSDYFAGIAAERIKRRIKGLYLTFFLHVYLQSFSFLQSSTFLPVLLVVARDLEELDFSLPLQFLFAQFFSLLIIFQAVSPASYGIMSA